MSVFQDFQRFRGFEQDQTVDTRTWCSLVLDPESRLMFWSDCSPTIKISSAGMDGTARVLTITHNWDRPPIWQSTTHSKGYSGSTISSIFSCAFDGTEIVALNEVVPSSYALDIMKDRIFWSSPVNGKFFSGSKISGSVPVAVSGKMSPVPYGIDIQHPSKQRLFPNPCNNTSCSHTCLLSPASSGFSCACPTGMELARNNRTCQDTTSQISLLFKSSQQLYYFHRRLIGKDSMILLPTEGQLGEIGAMAYDANGTNAVYSSQSTYNYKGAIYSLNLLTQQVKLLFVGVDTQVLSMDIDC